MPNPTPTQEEKDRALTTAQLYDTPNPGIGDSYTRNLARCHLHATAELARAEERIRVPRDQYALCLYLLRRLPFVYIGLWVGAALYTIFTGAG